MDKKKKSQYPGLSLTEPEKDAVLVAQFENFVRIAEINKVIDLANIFIGEINKLKQN